MKDIMCERRETRANILSFIWFQVRASADQHLQMRCISLIYGLLQMNKQVESKVVRYLGRYNVRYNNLRRWWKSTNERWWKTILLITPPLDFHHFNLLRKTQWNKHFGSNICNYLLDLVTLDVLKTISLKTLSGKPSGTKPDRREKEYSANMSIAYCFLQNISHNYTLLGKTQWDKNLSKYIH